MGESPSEMANCVNQQCIFTHNFTNKHKHRQYPGMPVTIRYLRRRCLYTINTQQGLTRYAFGLHLLIPTVLSTIYRLRRISNSRFPISNTPSPTDFRFPFPNFRFPFYRLRRIYNCRFPISNTPSPTDLQFPGSE